MGILLDVIPGGFEVPEAFPNHAAYLRWLAVTDVPEEVRIGYINGQVWAEVMAERALVHNRIKTAIAETVGPIIRQADLGIYFGDGMLFTSKKAKFTTYPDGMYISNESMDLKKATLTGAKAGQRDTQLLGSPDLVIEVISDYSEDKDTEWLMAGYWNAGVGEYWLVDARSEPLRFSILKRMKKEFTPVPETGGWIESPTLKREFRFVPGKVKFGHPTYYLEVR